MGNRARNALVVKMGKKLIVCQVQTVIGKGVKSAYEPSGPSGRSLSRFLPSMKRLGIFLLPPGWDASPWQG